MMVCLFGREPQYSLQARFGYCWEEGEEMPRTTEEVIRDLDYAVDENDAFCDFTQTALVVGFEQECTMIFHGDPDRQNKLNDMVRNGGIPLGLIKVARIGDDIQYLTEPLIEFRGNPETQKLLTELCNIMGRQLALGNKDR
jgi:hypothetical protein